MTIGTGNRRLLPARRIGAFIAERLDGRGAQAGHVESELAALAAGRRREQDALVILAGEFHRAREEDHALLRRQAEALEIAAAALTKLSANGTPASAADDELRALQQRHDHIEDELRGLRESHTRCQEELGAARTEADRMSRRLAAAHAKLRRARDELAVARLPWWRRRRAAAPLG